MKRFHLFLFLPALLWGCGKDKPADIPIADAAAKPAVAVSEKSVRKEAFPIAYPVAGGPDKAEVVVTGEKAIEGETPVTGFRVDFYLRGTLLKSFPFTAKGLDGHWSVIEDFLSDSSDAFSDPRFLALNNGYDACGYLQTDYVFFIEEGGITFVDRLESLSDSGYGTWPEMVPEVGDGKLIRISRRTVEVNPDEDLPENDEDQPLVIAYRDSMRYDFVSGKWRKTQLTPKDRVYRTEKTTFNLYHNQD